MAEFDPILTNFTAGEFSSRLEGRVDLAKYRNACKTLLNMLIHPHGGASNRPGTYFVAEAKYSDKKCRLIRFEFSVLQAYIIEIGHLYMRFYMNHGQILGDSNNELITNGTFDDNINDWDEKSDAGSTISHSTDKMALTSDGAGYAWAEQDVAITIKNVKHILKFDFDNAVKLRIGSTSKGNEIKDDTEYEAGSHSIEINPGNHSKIYVQFRHNNADTRNVDNVSLIIDVYEISTPFTEDQIWGLKFAQSADVLYIVHPDHPPYKLSRT